MSGRRIILLALGWVMLSAQASQSVEQNDSRQSRAENVESNTGDHQPVAASPSRPVGPPIAPPDDSKAQEDRQRAEADLKAQQDMARYSLIMAVAAMLGVALSAFGLRLVFITFRETQRASQTANKTYQAFVDVERARIIAEPEGIEILPEAEHLLLLKLNLTNIGKSSAALINCQARMNAGVDFPGHDVKAATAGIHRALEPGDTMTVGILCIDIRRLENEPFIGGFIRYRTAFGSTHYSYFLTMVGSHLDLGAPNWVRKPHPHTDPENRKRFGWPDDD